MAHALNRSVSVYQTLEGMNVDIRKLCTITDYRLVSSNWKNHNSHSRFLTGVEHRDRVTVKLLYSPSHYEPIMKTALDLPESHSFETNNNIEIEVVTLD